VALTLISIPEKL